MKPHPLPPIPEDTRQVAQQIYAPGTLLRVLGEEFAQVVGDQDFADLYSNTGQPALSPALLALVTVLQAQEHSSDRIAVEMVRSRIDWKYALHLPLNYAGFDPSVLCEFRQRLANHQAQRRVFDAFLTRLKDKGFLAGRHLQRTDSIAILGAIRDLNRLELVMETLRLALEAIVQNDPQWFRTHIPPEWLGTYAEWTQAERLVKESGPHGVQETKKRLLQTGTDGFTLLDALDTSVSEALRGLPAVETFRSVWSQQYQRTKTQTTPVALPLTEQLCPPSEHTPPMEEALTPPQLPQQRLASVQDSPTATVALTSAEERKKQGWSQVVVTPHDPEARYASKRSTSWTGYKLHLTETATEEAVCLITDVAIVAAASYDGDALEAIQQRLKACGLAPTTHLVDAGYIRGETLAQSQAAQVELLGPAPFDIYGARHKASGFSCEHFDIDFDKREALCPGGQRSVYWKEHPRSEHPDKKMIVIRWHPGVCHGCPFRQHCLGSTQNERSLMLSEHYPLLSALRKQQKTPAFAERYRRRSGVEASLSHLMNVHQARRTRYHGSEKTLGYYAFLAVGENLQRLVAWLAGKAPKRKRATRLSRWAATTVSPPSPMVTARVACAVSACQSLTHLKPCLSRSLCLSGRPEPGAEFASGNKKR
jgi:transposase